jgi:hypothetical protein
LQLLDQCNHSAPPIPFPRCTVESYYLMGECLLRPPLHEHEDLRRTRGRGGGSHASIFRVLAGAFRSSIFGEDDQQE